MNLKTLMTSLRSKNIAVSEADGELVVRAPPGAMDAELMSSMKRHKPALLEALKADRFEADAMPARAETITPDMLTLVDLSQDEIDSIIGEVEGGAAAIRDIYPLAPLQEGILFHHLLQTQGDPYITRSILVFDRRERLDAFLNALQTVIARHDILRSSVHWQGVSQPVQVVHRHVLMPVEELPPAAPDRVEQHLLEHTDPRRLRMALQRAPLLAGYSIRDSVSGEYWFALLSHHLIDDQHTLQLILSEIRLLLDGRSEQLPKTEPFRNFIARMRSTDQSEHERYFRSRLHDIRTATVPFGFTNVMGDGSRVEKKSLNLESGLALRIRDCAKRSNVTAAALFHVAWASVLRQCSGCNDVVFGTVLSGRLHADSGGAGKAMGMFINTLPIRITLQGVSVREVLAATHKNLNELLAHEQASLALAQKCSGLPPSVPLFTSLLNYRHSVYAAAEEHAPLFEWEGIRVIDREDRTNYPLTLSVDDYCQGFVLTIQCAGDIEPLRINGYMQSALEAILTSIEEDSFKSVELIDIISADERRQLLEEFNATSAVLPTAGTLQALFEAQVEKTPEAKAVAFNDRVLSYAELNVRANRLAHYLIERGVGPDVPVGLCVERSLDMAVGLLGILKTGGAYVPLDPHYPKERLAYMVQDSGVRVLLTHRRLAQALAFDAADTVLLDGADASFESCASVNPIALNHPQDLAYIIYTSGSTGQPKGVMVSHANAVHSTGARLNYYPDPVDAYLLLSSFAFDSSVAGLFWTLSQGGCLVLPEDAAVKDPAALKDLIVRHRVSHLLTLPSFYSLLLQQAGAELAALSTAIVAGEACAVEVVKRHYAALPQVKLYNEYGPTEGTVWCSVYLTTPADIEGALPIGRPIDNMRLYILDRTGNPVPIGVAGELYVGGEGVTRGYWQRPALTAERFVPDPFEATGGRLYKTGDLARYRTDGNIEFIGRTDHQVKIRGFRIELGEIEAQLLAQPEVKEAVVLAREDRAGDKRLVAYWVSNESAVEQSDELCSDLQERLRKAQPDYMVPGAFVVLQQMPLSGNGKVDRARLPAPDWSGQSKADYEAPQTSAEEVLVRIWRQLLGVEQVGRHDNFFALGGDSILSIQLVSRARQAGLVITPKQVFECASVADLAAVAESVDRIVAEQGTIVGDVPLTPIQHWFFELKFGNPHYWNQALLLSVKAELTAEIFADALRRLLHHHDALRMRFEPDPRQWRQTNLAQEDHAIFERIDLSDIPVERRAERLQAEAGVRQATLNLNRGPLVRALWFDLGNEASQVLMVIHHLVVDGVSWRILLEDLSLLCRSGLSGETVALPAKTTSFQFWSRHLAQHVRNGHIDLNADYWLDPRRQHLPALPVDYPTGANLFGHEEEIRVELSAEQTAALLQEVPAAYRTQIDEVLLTALAMTLRDWLLGSGRSESAVVLGEAFEPTLLLIDREGHGRESGLVDSDLSRTVGWFTSVYPLLLTVRDEDSLAQCLKSVKEQIRAVPSNGIGYGLLRYLSDDEDIQRRLAEQKPARILFNYLGQLDNVLVHDELFALSSDAAGLSHDPADPRTYELDIVGSIRKGCLQLVWCYSRERYRQATIAALSDTYRRHLSALIEHCCKAGTGGYTPSDFQLSGLSQPQLDAWALPPGQIEDIYPLAPLQHGLMFHSLYQPDAHVYRIQLACRLTGPLDTAAFEQAWQQLLARHAVLRSRFRIDDSGKPLQIIDKSVRLPLAEHDWRDLAGDEQQQRWRRLIADDHARGFDFEQAPLMRLTLVQTAEQTHCLLWSYHHVLLDGWSMPLLIKEVFILYHALHRGAAPGLPPVRPYRDYAAWLQRQDKAVAQQYWRQTLAGFETATVLAADLAPQSRNETGATDKHDMLLTVEETERLQSFVKSRQLTLNTLAQAAWGLLLCHYSGNRDVVFGITVSGRPAELVGIEEQVGLFINTLPMRIRLEPHRHLDDWLQSLFVQNQDMRRYEYVPLAQIQSWSDIGPGRSLFESLLVFENYPIDQALTEIGGPLKIDQVVAVDPTNYPLSLTVFPGERLHLEIGYDSSRFDSGTVTAMLAHLRHLLDTFTQQPRLCLGNVPALRAVERQRIVHDWNATEEAYPNELCIHQLFEAQVEKTPNAEAVAFSDRVLSYAELNVRVNRLAHYLIERGVGPDVLVGVCVERSLDMVIALLAILKAGGAYVPIDPYYPEERRGFMLEDMNPPVVLTQARFIDFAFGTAHMLRLDDEWSRVDGYPTVNPVAGIHLDNLAYCIYTSGSTGRPKGAGVPHRGILNRLQWMQAEYRLDDSDNILQKTPYSFDVSVWEFFWPLMTGARLVVAAPELHKDSQGLVELIRRERITTLHFVSSMLQAFVETPGVEECASLKRVICSGEALSANLVQRFQQKLSAELHNLYGPTEASVDVSYWACPPECRENAIPIGRPIANIRLYILDSSLNPVPIGSSGELHIAGIGLGRGYLNRTELTAEKFIPDPFCDRGGRLYKTGDLVRYRTDGTIDYLGRIDHQVKIRGFRIELGEIEEQLLKHADIKEAAVMPREDKSGDKRLVAYIVGERTYALQIDQLKDGLKRTLPDYMIPSSFVVLEEMPLSANGKLDRKQLPAPDFADLLIKQYVAPRTETEEILAEIWKELLTVERIGIHDDFFEAGGHSLLATQLLFKIQKALPVKLSLKSFFERPTIAAQARILDGEISDDDNAFLVAEAELPADIMPLTGDIIAIKDAGSILLTGATGFLGAFLLADLLEQTSARIYCLIRGRNETTALDRLKKQIARFELAYRIDYRRVVPVCGDLSQPRLGISAKVYEELVHCVDAIFHNGALVNFIQPYRSLKAANVSGTEEVLRLAGIGQVKAVHYISTVSVFSGTSLNEHGFSESDEPEITEHLQGGYAQSKWVAERMVRTAAERGFHITVYRPGTIAGDSRNGVWNTDDFLCRVLKGCVQLGFAPSENEQLNMAPVDYISGAIVALSMLPQSNGSIFHLNHNRTICSLELLDGFVAAGLSINTIPYSDWVKKMTKGAESIAEFALAPLVSNFQEQPENVDERQAPRCDCRKTQQILKSLEIDCPSIDAILINRYYDFFIRSGFLEKPRQSFAIE